ncbi:MAG: hypothetical protein K6G24_06095 [Lachnospiraceae bacterium]|nr:hypothetical protein [Lachnospiraceae bacterium]
MDKKLFLQMFISLVTDDSVFIGYSDAQYSQLYTQKVQPILDFLQIEPEKKPVSQILNFKQNQQTFVDRYGVELSHMYLYHRMFGPLSATSLVPKIEEWYESCEAIMSVLLGTIGMGVESVDEMIVDHLEDEQSEGFKDGVEKIYEKFSTKDRTLIGKIDGKIDNFEQMKQAAYVDDELKIAQSVWPGVYKDSFKRYIHREQVGFDRCFLNVCVEEINKELFFEAMRKYEKEKDFPKIKVKSIEESDEKKRPVRLPIENNHFKEIKVELSNHVFFEFSRNNSRIEGASDIYLLKLYVKPDEKHLDLGNIRNYSVAELQNTVNTACNELKEKTGIIVDYEKITLNDVELNLTFVEDGDFDKIAKYASFYQEYVRAEYKTAEYTTRHDDMIRYGDGESYKKSHLVSTGYVTGCETVQIKFYDKKAETLDYIKSRGKEAKFELDGKALVRLEYAIKNPKQLSRYFKETVVCKMKQDEIEKTYCELTKLFFIEPYENKFVPESKRTLKKLLEKAAKLASRKKNANTEQKKRINWKAELIKDILSEEIWKRTTPALINENEIDKEMLPPNSTFSRKPKQYIEEIRNLLRESNIYPKDQVRAYDRLYNFLRKAGTLEGLSDCRRIGYTITDKDKWINRDNEIAEKEEWLRGITGDLYNPYNKKL